MNAQLQIPPGSIETAHELRGLLSDDQGVSLEEEALPLWRAALRHDFQNQDRSGPSRTSIADRERLTADHLAERELFWGSRS